MKRHPERGRYERDVICAILDEALVCHLGFVAEGQPYVIPTLYGRDGDRVYIHGSSGSRMLRALAAGTDVCMSVTLIDGLVLARSAFNHSMNYRSVVVFGTATEVTDPEEKLSALRCISQHVLPGRWDEVREPNLKELAATSVLSLPLTEASAKIRAGPPIDDEEDHGLEIWAGEIPLRLTAGAPVADPRLRGRVKPPPCVEDYCRRTQQPVERSSQRTSASSR